jgi:hypothetical protein
MFYDLFTGWFCLTPEQDAVSINWQVGPRFGRGFQHRIGRDAEGRRLLEQGENTWMS